MWIACVYRACEDSCVELWTCTLVVDSYSMQPLPWIVLVKQYPVDSDIRILLVETSEIILLMRSALAHTVDVYCLRVLSLSVVSMRNIHIRVFFCVDDYRTCSVLFDWDGIGCEHTLRGVLVHLLCVYFNALWSWWRESTYVSSCMFVHNMEHDLLSVAALAQCCDWRLGYTLLLQSSAMNYYVSMCLCICCEFLCQWTVHTYDVNCLVVCACSSFYRGERCRGRHDQNADARADKADSIHYINICLFAEKSDSVVV